MEGVKLNPEPKTVWQVLKALRTVHWENRRIKPILSGWMGGAWAVFMGSFTVKVTLVSSEKWRRSFGGESGERQPRCRRQSTHDSEQWELLWIKCLCPPPKIHMLRSSPQIFERRGCWPPMVMKMGPSWMELVFPFPTLWGYSKKLAVCSLEEGSHQNPTVVTPWSQTWSLWKCEKCISFIHKPPIYHILLQQPELRQECIVSTFWKIESERTCSGGPVVETLCFQCRGCGSHIWLGN